MDAPLRQPDAFEHIDQQPAAEPQPLPKELRDDIRRCLALLLRLGRWGPGAVPWIWGWSLIVCAYQALTGVKAFSAANVLAANCAVLGLIVFKLNNRVGAVVVPHLLSQLSEACVSAKGTATLSKTMKGIKALMSFNALVMGTMAVVMAIESKPEAPHEWVAAALLVALAAPLVVISASAQLAQDLTYLLAADAAEQVAADVQRVTAATADYNGLAKRVYRVHRDTVALSAMMTPVIFGQASVMFSFVLVWLFFAVGPRPPQGDDWYGTGNWYNFFLHQYVAAFLATIVAAQLVWTLSGPAKITSACQRIASAVNDLRVNADCADGAVTLATAEQGHQIEVLNRYINELNKNQGLGFLVLRKRITFTLVMALLVQTVSAMPVVITLMSIATGDQHEVSHQELMGSLQNLTVTNRGLMDCLQVVVNQKQVEQPVLADCLQAQAGLTAAGAQGDGR
jgi:hypothetical protein